MPLRAFSYGSALVLPIGPCSRHKDLTHVRPLDHDGDDTLGPVEDIRQLARRFEADLGHHPDAYGALQGARADASDSAKLLRNDVCRERRVGGGQSPPGLRKSERREPSRRELRLEPLQLIAGRG